MKKLLLLVLALTALINPLNAVLEWAYTPLLTTSFLSTLVGVVTLEDSKHFKDISTRYKDMCEKQQNQNIKTAIQKVGDNVSDFAKKQQFDGNMFFGIGIASGVAFVGLQVANRVLEKQV